MAGDLTGAETPAAVEPAQGTDIIGAIAGDPPAPTGQGKGSRAIPRGVGTEAELERGEAGRASCGADSQASPVASPAQGPGVTALP